VSQHLTIADSAIRQDSAGRFSLNDLHRAAGGEKRHGPSYWLAAQQTQELIDELTDTGIPVSIQRGGTDQGTYVAKELVYAYAMWISAAFHLKVIRAYDALVMNRPDPLAVLSDPAALRGLLAGYAERTQALEHQVAEQAPKVLALDRIADARGALCLTDAAKALQMRLSDLISWMQEHSWIHKRAGSAWLAYQPRITSGVLVHKVVERGQGSDVRVFGQVLVTPKGLTKLAELLQRAEVAGA
jgi:phage antirepressor YoqD-like protein